MHGWVTMSFCFAYSSKTTWYISLINYVPPKRRFGKCVEKKLKTKCQKKSKKTSKFWRKKTTTNLRRFFVNFFYKEIWSDVFSTFLWEKSENMKIVHIYLSRTTSVPSFIEIGDKKIIYYTFTFTSLHDQNFENFKNLGSKKIL